MRFPGFEGEWEKHTLGEVGEPYIGLTYSPADVVSEGGVIVFRSSNIQNGEIDYSDIVRVEKRIKDTLRTRKDDLLICARNGSPRLIGKNALLGEEDANQTFGAFMLVFRSKDNHFIHQLLSTKSYYSQVSENLGARINQITTANIKDFEFSFPVSKSERDKIASLLDMIDQRISIQSKVIEDCISLGQEVVSHAFSNLHTATVKLADICNRITERNTKQISNNVLTISAKEGLVSQTDYFNKSVASDNLSNYYLLHQGDFAYNKSYSSEHPWGAIKHLERFHDGVLSPLYFCFRPLNELVDTNYLQLYFDTALWYKHISDIAVEGARNHGLLNMAVVDFYRMPIPLPPLNEQKNIARKLIVFKQKLETEQAILRTYQSQKQYLLNQLFV
ncbi:MAG: restriction endonuclease subunit S [Bacteroidota bacterium]|nr:restriction endonuclease subunit S [Bacteroidota bacterium]